MGLGHGCPLSSHRKAGGRAEASLLPRRAPARSAAPQAACARRNRSVASPLPGQTGAGLARKHGEPRKADQPKVTTWPPPTRGDTPQRAENRCSNTHLYRKVPRSTTAKKGRNNPNSQQQMTEYQNMVYAYVPRLITQLWKGVTLFLMLPRGGTVKTGCNRTAARHQRSPRV